MNKQLTIILMRLTLVTELPVFTFQYNPLSHLSLNCHVVIPLLLWCYLLLLLRSKCAALVTAFIYAFRICYLFVVGKYSSNLIRI